MAFVSVSDFIDLWYKLKERGASYGIKKLVSDSESRIKSTWDEDSLPGSNWWQVNAVRARWNKLITGDENMIYPDYVVQKWLAGRQGLKMLSIGCGTGQRELEFARHTCFKQIDAFDIAPKAIEDAKKSAANQHINNCNFYVGNVYKDSWPDEEYDVVLFHSSLHHFKHIGTLLDKVKSAIKPGGIVVINEYVGANRFQFSKERKRNVNKIYRNVVPDVFKERKHSRVIKHSVYFPGKLRMIISDPSEAVESVSIPRQMKSHFTLLEQKNYGGNLITFILKDIAHHFNKPEAQPVLEKLFALEDEWISHKTKSDFIFAVYQK